MTLHDPHITEEEIDSPRGLFSLLHCHKRTQEILSLTHSKVFAQNHCYRPHYPTFWLLRIPIHQNGEHTSVSIKNTNMLFWVLDSHVWTHGIGLDRVNNFLLLGSYLVHSRPLSDTVGLNTLDTNCSLLCPILTTKFMSRCHQNPLRDKTPFILKIPSLEYL